MFLVTAAPTQAFADALAARLDGDATLAALVEGVFGHMSEKERTVYPYVVIGDKNADEGAARSMGLAGNRIEIQVDVWSDHKGDSEALSICSRIYTLLERQPLYVVGFALMGGSVHCEMSNVFDESDEDKPQASLYHGVQRWTAEIDEAA